MAGMESAALFNIALTLLIPFTGLVCGAILPPIYYSKQFALSLIANIAGFIIYMTPLTLMALFFAALGEQYGVAGDWNPLLMIYLLAALSFFVAVEGFVFFLRWLRRYIRIRCDQQ